MRRRHGCCVREPRRGASALSELAEAERIRLQLQPGDRMVMVSDGVEPAFIQEMPGKSPGELAAAILEEAAAVGGGDDMTVMVCGVSEK